MNKNLKAIFIPGNGGGTPKDSWFPYLKKELESVGVRVIDTDFPDSDLAPESSWIPFLHELGADESTILVGYSSGAIAAMRFAEKNKIYGSALVATYHTDLNNPWEERAGYFNRPWDWEVIKKNQNWILQFGSTDDPFVPVDEARFVHEKLDSQYQEFTDHGHFGATFPMFEFPELAKAIKEKLQQNDK